MAANKVNGIVIKVPRVRLSFPDLFEARSIKSDPNSRPRFGVSAILDPKFPPHVEALKQINAEVDRIKKEGWGTKVPGNLKIEFLSNGDDNTDKEGNVYAGYAGMKIIRANAAETQAPVVLGKDKRELTKGDSAIYPGVYAHISFNLYISEKISPRICCGLRSVMSLEYGEPLAGRVIDADKEFADFDDGDFEGGASTDSDDDL